MPWRRWSRNHGSRYSARDRWLTTSAYMRLDRGLTCSSSAEFRTSRHIYGGPTPWCSRRIGRACLPPSSRLWRWRAPLSRPLSAEYQTLYAMLSTDCLFHPHNPRLWPRRSPERSARKAERSVVAGGRLSLSATVGHVTLRCVGCSTSPFLRPETATP